MVTLHRVVARLKVMAAPSINLDRLQEFCLEWYYKGTDVTEGTSDVLDDINAIYLAFKTGKFKDATGVLRAPSGKSMYRTISLGASKYTALVNGRSIGVGLDDWVSFSTAPIVLSPHLASEHIYRFWNRKLPYTVVFELPITSGMELINFPALVAWLRKTRGGLRDLHTQDLEDESELIVHRRTLKPARLTASDIVMWCDRTNPVKARLQFHPSLNQPDMWL